MTSKDYPKPDDQAGQQQASQTQTGQQPVAAGQAPDASQVLATLTEVFATFKNQLQSQAPKPFEGAAKDAVDVFNDIVAGLRLKFPPVPPNLEAKAVSSTDIELKWTDDTNNADGFKIRRCQGGDCQDFAEIKQVSSNVRAYQDVNLSSNTTYGYQLVAFNFRGETLSNIAEATTQIH
jgi:hypothetical protein